MNIGKIAFRNIFRNTKRSVLSVSAIMVATGAVFFMFSYITGILHETERNAKIWITGTLTIQNINYHQNEQLNPLHYNLDIEETTSLIKNVPGIKTILPRLNFPGMIYDKNTTLNHGAIGMGMDIKKEEKFSQISKYLINGRLPEAGKMEALIGSRLAVKLNKKIGDKFTTFTQTAYRSQNGATYKITGIINFPLDGMNISTFIIPLDRAQRLLKMYGKTKEFLIYTQPKAKDSIFKAAIEEKLTAEDYYLKLWSEDEMIAMFAQAQSTYKVFSFVFLLLAGTVIMNSLMMVIFERIREIGTIGALGMKARQIIRLFLTEGIYMSIAGAFGGILLGMAFVIPLSKYGIKFGEDLQMGSISFSAIYPEFNIGIVINVFIFSVVLSSLISFFAVRKSALIKPVEALRK